MKRIIDAENFFVKAESLNVAYLIELKEPPRRIDPLKLIAHKVWSSDIYEV